MHAVTPEVQKGQIPSAPWSQSCLFPFVRVGARCRSSPCLPRPLVSAITKLTPGHAGDAKSSPVLRTDARRGIRTCLASPLAPQAWTASAVDLVPTFLLSLCSFQAESSPGERLHANSCSFLEVIALKCLWHLISRHHQTPFLSSSGSSTAPHSSSPYLFILVGILAPRAATWGGGELPARVPRLLQDTSLLGKGREGLGCPRSPGQPSLGLPVRAGCLTVLRQASGFHLQFAFYFQMYMQKKKTKKNIGTSQHEITTKRREGFQWVKLAPVSGRNTNLHRVHRNILLKLNLN